MDDVIVLILRTMQEVSEDSGIVGDLDADCVFDCPHRGQSMDIRSDAAGALHEMLGISGIPSLQHDFDTPKHLAGTPGIYNFTAGHFNLNAKVTFDPCNRINHYSLTHIISSLLLKRI
jgi:hypothetical protein